MGNNLWPTRTLAEVCGGKGAYGLTASGNANRVGPKFLRTTDMIDGSIDWSAVPYCEVDDVTARKNEVRHGDLVISRTGANAGATAYVSEPPEGAVFAGYLVRFRADPKQADPRFLGFVLKSELWRSYVQNTRTGSAQPQLNAVLMGQFQFPVPPLAEQCRIAGVLGALDDLIEVNRGLIQDLAETATTLANQWALLASRKVILSEVADHLAGKYLAKEAYASGGRYVVYGSNSVMGTHSTFLHEGPLTVLARIGSYCGALSFSERNAWINNNASAIRAKDPADAYWLHEALLSIDMDVHRAGSGQPFVRIESLMNTDIPWLAPAELNRANELLGSLQSAIANLRDENKQLTETRDELVPLLMSGRIRVGEDVAA